MFFELSGAGCPNQQGGANDKRPEAKGGVLMVARHLRAMEDIEALEHPHQPESA